jgi:hypothetical protein
VQNFEIKMPTFSELLKNTETQISSNSSRSEERGRRRRDEERGTLIDI